MSARTPTFRQDYGAVARLVTEVSERFAECSVVVQADVRAQLIPSRRDCGRMVSRDFLENFASPIHTVRATV